MLMYSFHNQSALADALAKSQQSKQS